MGPLSSSPMCSSKAPRMRIRRTSTRGGSGCVPAQGLVAVRGGCSGGALQLRSTAQHVPGSRAPMPSRTVASAQPYLLVPPQARERAQRGISSPEDRLPLLVRSTDRTLNRQSRLAALGQAELPSLAANFSPLQAGGKKLVSDSGYISASMKHMCPWQFDAAYTSRN